ncbi:hypothetical protein AU490_14985 [Lonsdalea populi]|uniref:DUF1488 domain-containing protein n=2 Tax=Pectobacteriaceae TaxID=1903410 RepID=A0A3N0U7E9_9GAMM|nr:MULTISPECIES: DUF1488 domain-containing protein [Lonsdalea]RAT12911.1 hypothetical protein AU486_15330 [Lonsdalea quercina]RAT25860.1 hypothetical protein AU490_14985 [Lonsdalea populi]RAT32440.1 hypothetical protein AU491_11890 [Lonsdalea populi]RAT43155.1 hypothetical protein AU496_12950 [Lonsdalea populi]RAT49956.1 hypothetical protein AU498_14420 [Lonsdalea populi]
MNQSIQFPDREEWDEGAQAIRFPVQINGFQRECILRAASIQQRYGGSHYEEWLSLFILNRWDFEEEFESLIVNEVEDADGRFVL